MHRVHVRSGHVQPLWAGHPWVYAQAISKVEGAPAPGDVVDVVDPKGGFLGRGFWSQGSAIPVRVLSRDPGCALDDAWLRRRIEAAAAWRQHWLGLPNADTTGFRLIHAEGDDLAGLVCDRYGDVAVVQLLTAGMRRRAEAVAAAIVAATGVGRVVEVPSPAAQAREGIEATLRTLHGPLPDTLSYCERGLTHVVDLAALQKTGAYFDQRDNRARVEALARGRRVLDLYTYMGGFALAAARGGASEVLAVDRSATALAGGARAAHHAGLSERVVFAKSDVRKQLEALRRERKRFDIVVLDPPKLARTVRDLDRARKAYRHLNALACGAVEAGGLLVTCSCSAALKLEDFLRTVAMAARDAGRQATLVEVGLQAADHPTPASFPEGRYLKCAFVRIS